MASTTNNDNMLPVGTLLDNGRYRIEQQLSNGGFGNTYVATNLTFNDKVAVKEFFMRGMTHRENDLSVCVSNEENRALYDEQLQKFKKEAMRLRRLNNPHIVRVHDLFEANGTVYYVMDYIDGENLAERLLRYGHPMSEPEAMNYFTQVLDALEAVHAEGLVHSDLKPANIMVDKNGNAILIDFGASKQMANNNGVTVTKVSYTSGYAPFEQIEQDVAHFGPWTDIYALGATLYALLTFSKPPTPSAIFADPTPLKQETLPFNDNVSPATQRLIHQMMAMRWSERPQSIDALRALMAQPPTIGGTEATVISNPNNNYNESTRLEPAYQPEWQEEPEEGFFSRNKGKIFAFAGVLVALACLGLWLLLSESKSPSVDYEDEVTENTDNNKEKLAEKASQDLAQKAEEEKKKQEEQIAKSTPPKYYGQVNDPDGYTNIRRGASTDDPIVRKYDSGDYLYYTPLDNGWSRVYSGVKASNFMGYMHTSRIVKVDPNSSDSDTYTSSGGNYQRGYMIDPVDDYVNYREGPGTGYAILGRLDTYTDVYYVPTNSKWYKVYDTNYNYLGYVFHDRIRSY